MVATRQRWSEKEEHAIRLPKFQFVVLRMRIPPEKIEPDHSEASLATVIGDGTGDAKACKCMSRGVVAPKIEHVLDAQGSIGPEGNSCVDRHGKSDAHPAWCLARGACTEDGPATWENLVSPRRNPVPRGAGDLSPKRRVSAYARNDAPRTSVRVRGRPKARETVAEVNGNEGSEDCIRAMTSGNGRHPDPIEQRRSVSSSSLRREPCLLHR
jgi:hypothetical protein